MLSETHTPRDNATSGIYSAFLVEEEGTDSTFRALLEVFGRHGLPLSLYTDRLARRAPEGIGTLTTPLVYQTGPKTSAKSGWTLQLQWRTHKPRHGTLHLDQRLEYR